MIAIQRNGLERRKRHDREQAQEEDELECIIWFGRSYFLENQVSMLLFRVLLPSPSE